MHDAKWMKKEIFAEMKMKRNKKGNLNGKRAHSSTVHVQYSTVLYVYRKAELFKCKKNVEIEKPRLRFIALKSKCAFESNEWGT